MAMSSAPDHASAQQWISLTSVRVALPRSSRVWVRVAADSMPSLSGSVRPTYKVSWDGAAVVGGPSYTATVFGAGAAPSAGDALNAFTSQSISAGAFVVTRPLPG